MTPQLYINYKLKSVDHLPWRTLIYRFLNTIIDDLFAFLVTMPWLKRLACFRDGKQFINNYRLNLLNIHISKTNLQDGLFKNTAPRQPKHVDER
jgi:hypothetical protein